MMSIGLAGWAFWPSLQDLSERWLNDPQYSYGAVVPFAALLTFVVRRQTLPYERPPALLGLGVVAAGLGLDYLAETAFLESLHGIGFIVVTSGIILTLNGWATLVWALPGLILLLFAVPPPYVVHSALAEPLQRLVALGAAGLLELCGRSAAAVGDLVVLGDERVSVADACCGLGMLFVFLFAAGLIAALSRRPLMDKALVLLAAPAAGLGVNVLRIAATMEAKAQGYDPELIRRVHDVGGYLLGPVVLVLLLLILGTIALVFPTTRPADEPLQIAFQLGVADQADLIVARRTRSARPPVREH